MSASLVEYGTCLRYFGEHWQGNIVLIIHLHCENYLLCHQVLFPIHLLVRTLAFHKVACNAYIEKQSDCLLAIHHLVAIGLSSGNEYMRKRWLVCLWKPLNNLPLDTQNGCHYADDTFRCISLNEKICILITISLRFIPKGPIDNKPALV